MRTFATVIMKENTPNVLPLLCMSPWAVFDKINRNVNKPKRNNYGNPILAEKTLKVYNYLRTFQTAYIQN